MRKEKLIGFDRLHQIVITNNHNSMNMTTTITTTSKLEKKEILIGYTTRSSLTLTGVRKIGFRKL